MGFTLYNLLKAVLLLTNALAILHPHRFLAAHGLDGAGLADGGGGVKQQVAGLLHATRFMRCACLRARAAAAERARGASARAPPPATSSAPPCTLPSPRLHLHLFRRATCGSKLALYCHRVSRRLMTAHHEAFGARSAQSVPSPARSSRELLNAVSARAPRYAMPPTNF